MGDVVTDLLPDGWAKCSVGDITLPVEKTDANYNPEKVISYIDISSIDNENNIIGNTKKLVFGEAPSRARQIVSSGDVLFSTVRPYLRNIAYVPDWYDGQIASTGFSVLRPASGIDPAFLFYRTISTEFVNSLSGKQYGVSYPAVKDDQVRAQPLLLPPISEQHRIVAKIEELFSELDKGIECLKTAREQLKVYRQALLKHAFEGKLTEQWRKDNADKLETADDLLVRIQKERDRTLRGLAASGDAEAKRFLNKISKNDIKHPAIGLPNGAVWAHFLEFCTLVVDCHNKTAPYQKEGIYLIRTPCIRDGKIHLNDEVRFISQETYEYWSRRCPPMPGDIILTREAPMGEAGIVPSGIKLCMGQRMMLLRPPSCMDSKYLLYCMLEPLFQSRLVKDSIGTGVKHLRVGDIEKLCVPIFPLEEQIQIVDLIESNLSVIHEQEYDIERSLQQSETLRQSILKKAFSGQLVPQDPSDEPASMLLERIRAGKAAMTEKKKQTKFRKSRKRKTAA